MLLKGNCLNKSEMRIARKLQPSIYSFSLSNSHLYVFFFFFFSCPLPFMLFFLIPEKESLIFHHELIEAKIDKIVFLLDGCDTPTCGTRRIGQTKLRMVGVASGEFIVRAFELMLKDCANNKYNALQPAIEMYMGRILHRLCFITIIMYNMCYIMEFYLFVTSFLCTWWLQQEKSSGGFF